MSAKRSKTELLLSQHALQDLAEIEAFSIATWGKRTANKYLAGIEAALCRVRENPELLRREDGLHKHLRFYRIEKHLLVCDVQPGTIILLTVVHASRDIPSRLAELEPTLAAEIELLRKQLP